MNQVTKKTNFRRKFKRAKLHIAVHRLLKNRDPNITYLDIEKATEIPVHWIGLIANNKIGEPSAARLEIIYKFLAGKEWDC